MNIFIPFIYQLDTLQRQFNIAFIIDHNIFFQIVMFKYVKIYLSSNLTKNVGMNISYFGDNKCILAHLEFYLNHMQIRTNLCESLRM